MQRWPDTGFHGLALEGLTTKQKVVQQKHLASTETKISQIWTIQYTFFVITVKHVFVLT